MLDRMKDLDSSTPLKQVLQLVLLISWFLLKKKKFLTEAQDKVNNVLKQFRRGLITEEERYDRVISIWSAGERYYSR